VRITRDLDLAEECVQDAFAKALTAWVDGVPAKPGAWLTTVARNRAVDLLRRDEKLRRQLPLLVLDEMSPDLDESTYLLDDRLRLVFTCCHPALALEARVALTLRLLCGLSTAEVARAFLVSEPTMAARITRAKKKISQAQIPYRVPGPEELPERIEAVLTVLHLLFTTGHTAPSGDQLVRNDLVTHALDLCRLVNLLLPTAEGTGLLALMVLTDTRRMTRTAADGRLLLLEEQDRTQWDHDAIAEGVRLVRQALQADPPGKYALQAAIAAVHADANTWEQTDWSEIVALYALLQLRWPSPVVALNRAVAIGMTSGPETGLAALDALSNEPVLSTYSYFPAARADFLRRLGRDEQAITAYSEALLLTENTVERAFLESRLRSLRRRP
jgi:RNA polymerase sigma-70 factor (ECF subfamily)